MNDLTNEKTEDEMMLEPEISDESLEAAAGGRGAYTYLFFLHSGDLPPGH